MSVLDPKTRMIIEVLIDNMIKDSKIVEAGAINDLHAMGIDTNLETCLAYITGTIIGATYIAGPQKDSQQAMEEIRNILRRRAWELRETFIKSRFK